MQNADSWICGCNCHHDTHDTSLYKYISHIWMDLYGSSIHICMDHYGSISLVYLWRCPKMGIPPNHPFINGFSIF